MPIIAIIILIILAILVGYVVLGVAGELLILAVDALGRGFGVHNPLVGWVLVGATLGAIAGLWYGMRSAGAPLKRLSVGALIVLPLALLGALGTLDASDRPTPMRIRRSPQRVTEGGRRPSGAPSTGMPSAGASRIARPSANAADADPRPSASSNECHRAEGIACTAVPEEAQAAIERAFQSGVEAFNRRDMLGATARLARAAQLLATWSEGYPRDPWVLQTRRSIDTIREDIRGACFEATKRGEKPAGC